MGYIIIFAAIAFIFYKVYQFAMLHDARFAVVDETKVKGMIADLRANIGTDDFENKTKMFLNELEASLLTHEESVKLMAKGK
jgi:hypothetical protein